MKILQLITDRNLRGAQVFASQLSDQLAEKGHQVILASLYTGGNPTTFVSAKKAGNVELKGKKTLLSFYLLGKLRQLVGEFAPDIIQANGSDTLKYAVLSTLGARARPVLIYRNISMAGSWVHHGLQKKIYQYLFNRVDHVVSLTLTTRNEFISVYNYSANRVSILPIGVVVPESIDVIQAREAMARALGITPSDNMLFHIASFTEEKNHIGLLRIFRHVKEKIPSAVLVLVGDGVLRPAISDSVKEMRLQESVFLHGPRQDVLTWLACATVLVLPSLVEGLPGVVLEGMAHRVPVVAYDVGAIGEVIENGITGYVVQRGDENFFAEKIISLLEDRSSRKKISDEGYLKARSQYSLERIGNEFAGLYEQLLKNKRRP